MAGNWQKWLEEAGNYNNKKWLNMAGHDWKGPEMGGNGWKGLKMA